MTTKTRRFRVADGRTVILPRSIAVAPTGQNARYVGGDTFEIDLEKVDRFIRSRVRAGDLEEIDISPLPVADGRSRKDGER